MSAAQFDILLACSCLTAVVYIVDYRNLQTEYQMLQAERDRQTTAPPAMNGERQAEMLAEAKLLRQHKGRLETRMKILEDHNKQLEAQLRRLRHLLEQVFIIILNSYAMPHPHLLSRNINAGKL